MFQFTFHCISEDGDQKHLGEGRARLGSTISGTNQENASKDFPTGQSMEAFLKLKSPPSSYMSLSHAKQTPPKKKSSKGNNTLFYL